MEYKTLAEVGRVGEATPTNLSRDERLERWAAVLDRLGNTRLSTLWRTEHVTRDLRQGMRAENSPLTVAFEDPVLCLNGLNDDSFGEAKRFFELNEHQVHWVVCNCHFGDAISARQAAERVRALMPTAIGRWLNRIFSPRAVA